MIQKQNKTNQVILKLLKKARCAYQILCFALHTLIKFLFFMTRWHTLRRRDSHSVDLGRVLA